MTKIAVRRGQIRAALQALLPHAGRATDDTPDYGRLRFHPRGEDLLIWTTDGITSAAARCAIDEHHDPEVDEFDLAVDEARAVLAVIKRPTDKNQQSVWDTAECTITATDKKVHFAETGDLWFGRDVTVARLAGETHYTDVPRALHGPLTGTPVQPGTRVVTVDTGLLTRFATSARAYEHTLTIRPIEDPPALAVRIGERFASRRRLRAQAERGHPPDRRRPHRRALRADHRARPDRPGRHRPGRGRAPRRRGEGGQRRGRAGPGRRGRRAARRHREGSMTMAKQERQPATLWDDLTSIGCGLLGGVIGAAVVSLVVLLLR